MDASHSVFLVRGVVIFALVSYTALLVTLSGRRWSTTWALILAWVTLELVRTGGWFGLTFRRRAIYEQIPPDLWVVMTAQTLECVVLWVIALRAILHDRAQPPDEG